MFSRCQGINRTRCLKCNIKIYYYVKLEYNAPIKRTLYFLRIEESKALIDETSKLLDCEINCHIP